MADIEETVEDMPDVECSVATLGKMKVAELRKELKDRSLSVLGSKAELVNRLQKALTPGADLTDDPDPEAIEEITGDENEDVSDSETPDPEPDTKSKEDEIVESSPDVMKRIPEPSNNEADVVAEEDPDKIVPTPEAAEALTKTSSFVAIRIDGSSEATPTTTSPPAVTVKAALSSDEKLKQRAERFGISSESDKKAARAARFGLSNNSSTTANKPSAKIAPTPLMADDLDRLKKRAERFGTVVSSTLSKLDDEAKLRKRKERFGHSASKTSPTSTTAISGPVDSSDVSKKSDDGEEKKRKRAERFGLL